MAVKEDTLRQLAEALDGGEDIGPNTAGVLHAAITAVNSVVALVALAVVLIAVL